MSTIKLNNLFVNQNKLRKLKIYDSENGDIDYKKFKIIENKIKKLVKNKSLVLFAGGNDSISLATYLALFRLKHCQILVEKNISKDNLNIIIKKFEPEYIFIDNKEKFDNKYKNVNTIGNYNFLKITKSIKSNIHKNLAILISTSGTTGESKFVKLTFENIIENTKSIQNYLNLNSFDVGITTLPISYSYGLSVVNIHLFQDLKIVCNNNSIIEKTFWNSVKKFKVTNIAGVPFNFEILDRLGLIDRNLCNIRFFTQAGGRLEEDIIKRISSILKKKNINFFIMYGQTEAAPRISYLSLNDFPKKIGSVGKVVSGGKLSINKSNNEIIYEGLNIFKGYSKNRGDLSKLNHISKLYTGDKGYLDNEKFLYITGRINREIKIYGKRINLDLIEKIINLKFNIRCACKNKENNIFIVSTKNIKNFDQMKNIISNEFGISKSCLKLKVISKFPINSNNKINYSKIVL